MLLVAPSSAMAEYKERIIASNKLNAAKVRRECAKHGIEGVKSRFSIYGDPVFPLPQNYKPYSVDDRPVPTEFPSPMMNLDETIRNLKAPESIKNTKNAKGKEPERVPPTSSTPPVPRSSHGQSSTTSNVPFDDTPGGSSNPTEEARVDKKATNDVSHTSSYQPSISQQSYASSEKSYQTPITPSQASIKAPAKTDRYYPPQTKSAYFSAPPPSNQQTENKASKRENNDAPGADTATQSISTVARGAANITPPASIYNEFTSDQPTTSIGPAIAPPRPPCIVAPPPVPCSTEDATGSEQETSKTKTTSTRHVETPQGEGAHTPSSTQKRTRRLSKTRKPGSSDGKSRSSLETPRRNKTKLTAATTNTTISVDRVSHMAQPRTSEVGKEASGSDLKSGRKLRKKAR
ncbi:hypothetical protein Daesc_010340 [Daldinia eschscholtzii]|uniref:Uncharacterized protein n=1 Tax=Daldinia eschscholtzii TaxID=292717 RepID=A0AAX6M7D8_9PEZI